MRIIAATTQWIRIPLPEPVGWSIKTVSYREYVLVRIRSDAGVEGIGYLLQDTSGAPAKAGLDELLVPIILGQDPRDIRFLWERMYAQTVRAGRRGNLLHAMSAIDIALWDHNAKAVNLPLYKLLGAYRTEVPTYASGGYYYTGAEMLPRLEAEIRGYLEQGYQAVKMKVGRLDPTAEEERVRLVREILGSDRLLMIDANQAYQDVNACAQFCRRIEKYDIAFFEEPLPVDMLEGYVRLKRRTSIPLATGEVEATRWAFQQLIRTEAIDVIQPDATVCGGITEWLNINALAAAQGVSVAPHYNWDVHVHLGCISPQVSFLEKFEGTAVTNFDLVLRDPHRVTERSTLAARNRPGLGIELDEAAIRRFLVQERVVEL